MDFDYELKSKGFSLMDVNDEDIENYILTEKLTHYKYVAEHTWFFGEWDEDVLRRAFELKRRMTFFRKILWKEEIVGYLCFDQKIGEIDDVFIRIVGKAQNKGIGTLFFSYLKELSKEHNIPISLVVIKTNPAQVFYEKLGFERYKEQDVFFYYRYEA